MFNSDTASPTPAMFDSSGRFSTYRIESCYPGTSASAFALRSYVLLACQIGARIHAGQSCQRDCRAFVSPHRQSESCNRRAVRSATAAALARYQRAGDGGADADAGDAARQLLLPVNFELTF